MTDDSNYQSSLDRNRDPSIFGGILGWAGSVKIYNPEAFIKIVKAYDLLPEGLVVLWGIFLPWIELVTGLFLFLGLWHKSAVLSSSGLFLIFAAAVGINILRGADIACGCFGFNDTNLYVVLLQDLVFLLCCCFLFFLNPLLTLLTIFFFLLEALDFRRVFPCKIR